MKYMHDHRNPLSKADLLLAISLAIVAFSAYVATLTPSLSYLSPDGNELATIPFILGLAHSPGYPLYAWLGKAFTWLPIGDIAHRINLMSAALGAFGVGGLYLIAINVLHPNAASPLLCRSAAALSALLFACTPTFWSQAVIAEVYAPNIALIALTILLVLRWDRTRRDLDFFFFALVFGLSLGTHISNLGFAPAFALFVLLSDWKALLRPTWWLAGLSGFGLGLMQFAWLPLRANSLNDRLMLARAPTTLLGIYHYTLGAFPQFKFAFSIAELPDRIVVYLDLLHHEFSLAGIVLGLIGLVALLFRRTRYYYLLMGMYLVHVWFFIQYRVFDLEVFFLPAHFLWAIFLAFGTTEALGGLVRLFQGWKGKKTLILQGVLAAITLGMAIPSLVNHWQTTDRSKDVAVNDFYANVWELLPSEAALLTQSGVFGYDAFYWRLIYQTRQDVLLPSLTKPNPAPIELKGRDLFATTSVMANALPKGPGTLRRGLISPDVWQIPFLIGQQGEANLQGRNHLVLYHLTRQPPPMAVDSAHPNLPIDRDLGGLTLLGADLDASDVESGGRFHLTLYWRMDQPRLYHLQTNLGDQVLESHELGYGNLSRYQTEVESIENKIIVEEVWLVVPSTTPPGEQILSIRLIGSNTYSEIGRLWVINQEETMDRWLRIAGKS